jgi:tripartite ATP-independent transporter DctP family solute receptor
MTSVFSFARVLFCAVILVFGAMDGAAQAAKVIRAGLTDPLDTPHGQAMVLFKEQLEKETNGGIKVQLFPSLQLGQILEQVEGVQQGSQEMMMATPAWFSRFFPAIDVFSLPYLVKDWKTGEKLFSSPVTAEIWAAAEKASGIKIAGVLPVGFRNVINKKLPVRTIADLSGLKIRLQNSPVQIATFKALGANPVVVAWGETYQAVQTGMVDGMENSLPIIASNKFADIAKNVSRTQHFFEHFLVFVNSKFYAGLTEQERAAYDKAMIAARDHCIELVKKAEESAIAAIEKQGGKVNSVEPAELAKLEAAVKPVYDEFGKKFEPYFSKLRQSIAN